MVKALRFNDVRSVSIIGINKRECRKYLNPGIKLNSGSGVLHFEKIEYIVCAAIKNIAGRRALILYLYNCRKVIAGGVEPEYTLFQYRDDYITLHKDSSGNEKWREASLHNMGDRYTNFTKTCAFYRFRDEQLVTRFCNISEKTGFEALNALQSAIMSARLTKRIIKRERKIIERMIPIPAIPRRFKSFIHREVLPHYVFYDYCRGNKPKRGYCTACRHNVLVNGTKHNSEGQCPNCEKKITFKSSGRSKRVWDRTTVQVLQRISEDELVLRVFKVNNWLRNWREPVLDLWENTRVFIRRDEADIVKVDPYYYSYNIGMTTHWRKGERSRFSYYQYSFECDVCGHLYCKNLDDVLKGTAWQYSQLERFYSTDREPLEVIPYLLAYNKYPAIEYLVKLGLTELASTVIYKKDGAKVINEYGRNLRETLGIEPDDLPVLQKINANKRQFELYQRLKLQGIKADETLLLWYQNQKIASAENVSIPLRYTTSRKLMRYIEEQFECLKDLKTQYGGRRYESVGRVLSDYKDYLSMGGLLEYDFKNSFVLFPKNLPEAHDQTSKLFSGKKSGIFKKVIRAAYESLLEKYCFTRDGLTLIPPKTEKEIISEGHTLHHCVYSYVEKVAKGECLILFIRQTENIKKPFYTLEIQNGQVIQIQGKYHCEPTPEVKKFLEFWVRKKLRAAS